MNYWRILLAFSRGTSSLIFIKLSYYFIHAWEDYRLLITVIWRFKSKWQKVAKGGEELGWRKNGVWHTEWSGCVNEWCDKRGCRRVEWVTSLEGGGEAACRIMMRGCTYNQRLRLTLARATWSRQSAGRVIKVINYMLELVESNNKNSNNFRFSVSVLTDWQSFSPWSIVLTDILRTTIICIYIVILLLLRSKTCLPS